MRDRLDDLPAGRLALFVFAALLLVYLPTATYDIVQVTDTHSSMVAAWGLGTTGGVALPETWQDMPWRSWTVDGDMVSNRFPGPTIWGAVFYAVLPTATEAARAHDVPAWPAAIAAAVSAAAAMAVLFLVLDRVVGDRRLALAGALVMALATPTWAVSADALWTHGPAQLALALAMLALVKERWWWAGAAMGAAMVCRPQLGVVAAVVGLYLAARRRDLRPAVAIGLAALPGLLFLMVWTHELFGTWVPVAGYGTGKAGAVVNVVADPGGGTGMQAVTNFAPLLLHPIRGVLIYSLWLLPVLPGLRAGWRQARPWVRACALAGLVLMFVQLASNSTWHGGDDHFGYRLPLEWITLSMPLLVLAWREGGARQRVGRIAMALLLPAALFMNLAGATFADPRTDERQAYLELVDTFGPNGEGYNMSQASGVDARP